MNIIQNSDSQLHDTFITAPSSSGSSAALSALFELTSSTTTASPMDYTTPAAMFNDSVAGGNSTKCEYEEPPLTTLRFWVVSVFGTSIALCSIVENLFFFYLFSTRKHHRTTFNMYMMFISLFDIFISISYILIQSMNVLMDFLQSLTLFRIWHIYMVPFLTISHCAITSGSFLILAATIERYLLSANSKHIRWVQRNRRYIIMFAILMGILSKVTICLELKISYLEQCANTMNEIEIKFADFVFDTDYHLYWRFYYRNFVTIFFPFFALLILNAKIISVLAKVEKENYKFQMMHSSTTTAKQMKRKKVTRAATITTILLVCSYLVSNIISVALTTWEHIDKQSLGGEYVQIYFIAIDLSSLLTVCSCAFRPLIYLICQPGLRKEVFYLMKGLYHANDEIGDPKGGAQFTKTSFEPMYNSLELSSCMQQASPGTPADVPKHPLTPSAYPQVLRASPEVNNNNKEAENAALLNNKLSAPVHERRTSLTVVAERRNSANSKNHRRKMIVAQQQQQPKVQQNGCGYRQRCSSNGSAISSDQLRNILCSTAEGDETLL
uniref:G_PROTEIN_RECEP_F1_2 domain-containing protein n=1 Tax=Globodera pallida TaxID=36090 RepID=A0A183C1E6_GLOPA